MRRTSGDREKQRDRRLILQGRRNLYLFLIFAFVTLAFMGMQSVGRWFGLAVPDTSILSVPPGDFQNYPPVRFPHRNHSRLFRDANGQPIDCVVCHHKEEGEITAPPPLCSECHGTLDNPVDDNPLFIHIFHLRCTDCHRQVDATGRRAGPITDCFACHQMP